MEEWKKSLILGFLLILSGSLTLIRVVAYLDGYSLTSSIGVVDLLLNSILSFLLGVGIFVISLIVVVTRQGNVS
jgi:hypothetical protein